ncbi:MAG: response regulator [Spirochaetales bacterium]|nr:response regulator [Spirochaetales bacterium]
MKDNGFVRILVVDDDPAIQKVLRIGLGNAGYEPVICRNGRECLSALEEKGHGIKTIVLDIRMPDITGLDLLPKIKKMDPLTPVIMLTAFADLETGLAAMKSQAFDYVVKPVRLIHLTAVIEKALYHRSILEENERLNRKNEEYRLALERKVEERTAELQQAYVKLRQTNLETVRVLAETIEAKDQYTRGHCQRVRLMSAKIALKLGYKTQEIRTLEYAALLHDIGKIGIPELLLHKDSSLTEEERSIFQMHPKIGETILSTVEFFQPCLDPVRQHHEHYDGSGYPDGLTGEKIDPLAKIIVVADAFDAMTSTRPYRNAMPLEVSLKELNRCRGSHFDPEIVDVLTRYRLFDGII